MANVVKTGKLVVSGAVALGLFVLMTGGWHQWRVRQLSAQVGQLQEERVRLLGYMERMASSRRVAQVDVVKQYHDNQGRTVSALLWQEIGEDGTLGAPQALEAVGDIVYFEAAVIKFPAKYVQQGDADRGSSLVLFRRVFGDRQIPAEAPMIDAASRPTMFKPAGSDRLEDDLWNRFWELVESPAMAETYDVRIAQIEAPAVPLRIGQVWEVTLDAAGGLNLRSLGARRPLDKSSMGAGRADPSVVP